MKRFSGTRQIGLLGGTFDPIHLGHLAAASEFKFALKLDEVWFLPAGAPPHKPDQTISSIADRARMIDLAIAGVPGFKLSMIDAASSNAAFTVDLIQTVRGQFPEDAFTFLMGSDSFRDLPSWWNPDQLLELVDIGVATRPGVSLDVNSILQAVGAKTSHVEFVNMPLIGISSSDIRNRVKTDQPVTFLIPERVERYILANHLYQEEPTTRSSANGD